MTREAVYSELVKSLGEKESLQVNTDLEKSRFEMKVKLVRERVELALRNADEEEQGVRDVRRKQQAAGRC